MRWRDPGTHEAFPLGTGLPGQAPQWRRRRRGYQSWLRTGLTPPSPSPQSRARDPQSDRSDPRGRY